MRYNLISLFQNKIVYSLCYRIHFLTEPRTLHILVYVCVLKLFSRVLKTENFYKNMKIVASHLPALSSLFTKKKKTDFSFSFILFYSVYFDEKPGYSKGAFDLKKMKVALGKGKVNGKLVYTTGNARIYIGVYSYVNSWDASPQNSLLFCIWIRCESNMAWSHIAKLLVLL